MQDTLKCMYVCFLLQGVSWQIAFCFKPLPESGQSFALDTLILIEIENIGSSIQKKHFLSYL